MLANGAELFVVLSGLVDFNAERARLEKEIAKFEKDHLKYSKKLSNPGFLANAAPEVIERDKAKVADMEERLRQMRAQLADMA